MSLKESVNYCKFKWILDVEKNPGPTPMHVDSRKTYSQGDELAFRQNAWQQCDDLHQSVRPL